MRIFFGSEAAWTLFLGGGLCGLKGPYGREEQEDDGQGASEWAWSHGFPRFARLGQISNSQQRLFCFAVPKRNDKVGR